MSDIKWCDVGGHAFSVNDPDRQSYANTTHRPQDGGDRERLDICGPCVKKNVMGVKSLTAASQESAPPEDTRRTTMIDQR